MMLKALTLTAMIATALGDVSGSGSKGVDSSQVALNCLAEECGSKLQDCLSDQTCAREFDSIEDTPTALPGKSSAMKTLYECFEKECEDAINEMDKKLGDSSSDESSKESSKEVIETMELEIEIVLSDDLANLYDEALTSEATTDALEEAFTAVLANFADVKVSDIDSVSLIRGVGNIITAQIVFKAGAIKDTDQALADVNDAIAEGKFRVSVEVMGNVYTASVTKAATMEINEELVDQGNDGDAATTAFAAASVVVVAAVANLF